MSKPHEVILKVKKQINGIEKEYLKSAEFETVARNALIDFIKRVKRGFMPSLGKIPEFKRPNDGKPSKYIELRKKNANNLGDLAKPSKSNATATGQMLNAMIHQVTEKGFILYVRDSRRGPDITGRPSRINNDELASYYAKERPIFDFSKPEIDRIIRNVRRDLLAIIRRLK